MDCILYSSIYRGSLIINKVDHILSILYYFSVIYVSLKHVISTSPNPSYKNQNSKKQFSWTVTHEQCSSWTVPPQIKNSSTLLQLRKPSKLFSKSSCFWCGCVFLGDLKTSLLLHPDPSYGVGLSWWNIWAKYNKLYLLRKIMRSIRGVIELYIACGICKSWAPLMLSFFSKS